jgi:hypothetical protein
MGLRAPSICCNGEVTGRIHNPHYMTDTLHSGWVGLDRLIASPTNSNYTHRMSIQSGKHHAFKRRH